MAADWLIEVENSGGTFISDGYIQRPNEDMETAYVSTTTKIKLADGSYGFMTPEIKRVKESFNMFFANTTSAFRTQIEDYMLNGDKVRITTHNGETFTGKFIELKRVWFSGIEDSFDINVIFDRYD